MLTHHPEGEPWDGPSGHQLGNIRPHVKSTNPRIPHLGSWFTKLLGHAYLRALVSVADLGENSWAQSPFL